MKSRVSFFFLLILSLMSKTHADEPIMDHRQERVDHIAQYIKPNARGLEIGVYKGTFAFHCFLKQDPELLVLIDPWEAYFQMGNQNVPLSEQQHFWDSIHNEVYEIFKPYPNVEIIRDKSENVFSMFEDGYFDYIYIDGEHSYDAVTRDLNNYYSKVKVDGYLMGDDYGWTGVAPAVENFLKRKPGMFQKVGNFYSKESAGQFVLKRIK